MHTIPENIAKIHRLPRKKKKTFVVMEHRGPEKNSEEKRNLNIDVNAYFWNWNVNLERKRHGTMWSIVQRRVLHTWCRKNPIHNKEWNYASTDYNGFFGIVRIHHLKKSLVKCSPSISQNQRQRFSNNSGNGKSHIGATEWKLNISKQIQVNEFYKIVKGQTA